MPIVNSILHSNKSCFFLVIPTVLLSEINLYAVKIEENQLIIKLTAFVHECKKRRILRNSSKYGRGDLFCTSSTSYISNISDVISILEHNSRKN